MKSAHAWRRGQSWLLHQVPARSIEDRLFAAASQAIVIAELPSLRVLAANPAAEELLRMSSAQLLGTTVPGCFADSGATVLAQAVATADLTGTGPPIQLRTRDRRIVRLTCSVTRRGADCFLLTRLERFPLADSMDDDESWAGSPVLDLIEDWPNGFLVSDPSLRLHYANRAFLRWVGLDSVASVCGQSLARWLDLSQAELTRMTAQFARREAVTAWTTLLRSTSGDTYPVTISAVAVPEGGYPCWGFCLDRSS